jgi:predicted methyltransferase
MKSALPAMLLFAAVVHAQSPQTHEHAFDHADNWSRVFDDPARDAWQKPHEVMGALALKRDAIVADIGAGTGYFSARLSRMLPQGKVYAVDVEPDMVKYLGERAAREGLKNLFPVTGSGSEANLPEPVDLVLLVDVYHHVGERVRYFDNLKNSLKAGARVAIIDFRLDAKDGPPRAARIAPAQVKTEMQRAGYALSAEHAFLPSQYFLVFKPD